MGKLEDKVAIVTVQLPEWVETQQNYSPPKEQK